MPPKGGVRKGAGRKPAFSIGKTTGKKVLLYLASDLVSWWLDMPARTRAKFINAAIREKLAREVPASEPGEG